MIPSIESPLRLNTAVDELVQALESVTDLQGLRHGLAGSIAFWSGFADPADPNHRDALELVAVWERLDALAGAVQYRKEQG